MDEEGITEKKKKKKLVAQSADTARFGATALSFFAIAVKKLLAAGAPVRPQTTESVETLEDAPASDDETPQS